MRAVALASQWTRQVERGTGRVPWALPERITSRTRSCQKKKKKVAYSRLVVSYHAGCSCRRMRVIMTL